MFYGLYCLYNICYIALESFVIKPSSCVHCNIPLIFLRYRGLKSFVASPWDPMENLPLDYARIYRFENFRQTKKKVLKSEREGVEVRIL